MGIYQKKHLKFWLLGAFAVLLAAAIIKSKYSKNYLGVEVEKVGKGNITEIVSANGKIQPETEVVISPEVPGEILEITVREGDRVSKGDLLVNINPDILLSTKNRMIANLNSTKANLASSEARLEQVRAQHINASLNYERSKKLIADGAISRAQFDQDEANYLVAKAEVLAAEKNVDAAGFNVKNAEAALQEADRNLYRTTIFAPRDGTVSLLKVEEGERVVGTSQMSGTEIMRIADLSKMEVIVDVNESDIVRVSLGDTADIEVDAFLNRTFKGVVTAVANTAKNLTQTGDQVTNFEVKVSILNSSYQDLMDTSKLHLSPFRPGMTANVEIATQRVFDVIKVPVQSVTLRLDSSLLEITQSEEKALRECVFLKKDNIAQRVFVQPGIQDTRYIEIKSADVEIDDEVITGPYELLTKKLKNNDLIELTNKEKTPK